MKKLIAACAALLLTLVPLFADDSASYIQLSSTVAESDLSAYLAYNLNGTQWVGLDDYIHFNDRYVIDDIPSLTEDGQTHDFRIAFSYNAWWSHRLDIFISPSNFYSGINNAKNKTKVTDIAPVVHTTTDDGEYSYDSYYWPWGAYEKGIYLVAGYHVDLLTKFYLSWDGDSTLDPGTYYSDVTITYQIQ
jgi:hypothetical protein